MSRCPLGPASGALIASGAALGDVKDVGKIPHARRAASSVCDCCSPWCRRLRTRDGDAPPFAGGWDFRPAIACVVRPTVVFHGAWRLPPPCSLGPASGALLASGAASVDDKDLGSISHARRAAGVACDFWRPDDGRSRTLPITPALSGGWGIRPKIAWALRPVIPRYRMRIVTPQCSWGPYFDAVIASAACGDVKRACSILHAQRHTCIVCDLFRHGDSRFPTRPCASSFADCCSLPEASFVSRLRVGERWRMWLLIDLCAAEPASGALIASGAALQNVRGFRITSRPRCAAYCCAVSWFPGCGCPRASPSMSPVACHWPSPSGRVSHRQRAEGGRRMWRLMAIFSPAPAPGAVIVSNAASVGCMEGPVGQRPVSTEEFRARRALSVYFLYRGAGRPDFFAAGVGFAPVEPMWWNFSMRIGSSPVDGNNCLIHSMAQILLTRSKSGVATDYTTVCRSSRRFLVSPLAVDASG